MKSEDNYGKRLYYVADLAFKKGNYSAALECLKELILWDPQDAKFFVYYLKVANKSKDIFDLAFQKTEEIIGKIDLCPAGYHLRSFFHLKMRNFKAGLEDLNSAIRLSQMPKDRAVYLFEKAAYLDTFIQSGRLYSYGFDIANELNKTVSEFSQYDKILRQYVTPNWEFLSYIFLIQALVGKNEYQYAEHLINIFFQKSYLINMKEDRFPVNKYIARAFDLRASIRLINIEDMLISAELSWISGLAIRNDVLGLKPLFAAAASDMKNAFARGGSYLHGRNCLTYMNLFNKFTMIQRNDYDDIISYISYRKSLSELHQAIAWLLRKKGGRKFTLKELREANVDIDPKDIEILKAINVIATIQDLPETYYYSDMSIFIVSRPQAKSSFSVSSPVSRNLVEQIEIAPISEELKKSLLGISSFTGRDFSFERLWLKIQQLLAYEGENRLIVRLAIYNGVIKMAQAVSKGDSARGQVLGLSGEISGLYEVICKRGAVLENISLGTLQSINTIVYDKYGESKEFDAMSENTVFEFKFHLTLRKLYQQVIGTSQARKPHLKVLTDPRFNHIRNIVYFGETDDGSVVKAIEAFVQDRIKNSRSIPEIKVIKNKGISAKFTLTQMKDFLLSDTTKKFACEEEKTHGARFLPRNYRYMKKMIYRKLSDLRGAKFDVIVGVSTANINTFMASSPVKLQNANKTALLEAFYLRDNRVLTASQQEYNWSRIWRDIRLPQSEFMVRLLNENLFKNNEKVLSLGCGRREDEIILARDIGCFVTATDNSPVCINKITKEALRQGISQKLVARIQDLLGSFDFCDEEFETVFANCCLISFDDKRMMSIVDEIWRVLRRGGKVFAMVYSKDDNKYGKGLPLHKDLFNINGMPYRFFDFESLEKAFKGFIDIEIRNARVRSLDGETRKMLELRAGKPLFRDDASSPAASPSSSPIRKNSERIPNAARGQDERALLWRTPAIPVKSEHGIAKWLFGNSRGTFIIREWRFDIGEEYEVNINITHYNYKTHKERYFGYSDYFTRGGHAIIGKNLYDRVMITFKVHNDYQGNGLGTVLMATTLLSAKALGCTLAVAHHPVTSIPYNVGFIIMENGLMGVFDLMGNSDNLPALKKLYGIKDFPLPVIVSSPVVDQGALVFEFKERAPVGLAQRLGLFQEVFGKRLPEDAKFSGRTSPEIDLAHLQVFSKTFTEKLTPDLAQAFGGAQRVLRNRGKDDLARLNSVTLYFPERAEPFYLNKVGGFSWPGLMRDLAQEEADYELQAGTGVLASSPISDEESAKLQAFVDGLNIQVIRIKNSVSQIKSASLVEEVDKNVDEIKNAIRLMASGIDLGDGQLSLLEQAKQNLPLLRHSPLDLGVTAQIIWLKVAILKETYDVASFVEAMPRLIKRIEDLSSLLTIAIQAKHLPTFKETDGQEYIDWNELRKKASSSPAGRSNLWNDQIQIKELIERLPDDIGIHGLPQSLFNSIMESDSKRFFGNVYIISSRIKENDIKAFLGKMVTDVLLMGMKEMKKKFDSEEKDLKHLPVILFIRTYPEESMWRFGPVFNCKDEGFDVKTIDFKLVGKIEFTRAEYDKLQKDWSSRVKRKKLVNPLGLESGKELWCGNRMSKIMFRKTLRLLTEVANAHSSFSTNSGAKFTSSPVEENQSDIVREEYLNRLTPTFRRMVGLLNENSVKRVIHNYYLRGSIARGDFIIPPGDIDFAVSVDKNHWVNLSVEFINLLNNIRAISQETGFAFHVHFTLFGPEYYIGKENLEPTGRYFSDKVLKLGEVSLSRRILIRLYTHYDEIINNPEFLIELYRKSRKLNLTGASSPVGDSLKPFQQLLTEYFVGPYHNAVLDEFVRSERYEESIGYTAADNFLFKYQYLLGKIYSRVGDLRGKSAIEFGCGPGVVVEILRRLGGVEVIGVEAEQRFVSFAQKYNVPLIQGTLMQVPVELAGKSFDLTFSNLFLDALATIETKSNNSLKYRRLDQNEKLKVLDTIAALTSPGAFSMHATCYSMPFTKTEFKQAGFKVIKYNRNRTLAILRKEFSSSPVGSVVGSRFSIFSIASSLMAGILLICGGGCVNAQKYREFNIKSYPETISYYSDVIKAKPENAGAYYDRGHTYVLARKFQEAQQDIAMALELDQNISQKLIQDWLKDKDPAMRYIAIQVLGEKQIEKAIIPLLGAYNKDEDPYIKRYALAALSNFNTPFVTTVLLEATKNDDNFIRGIALTGLGERGYSETHFLGNITRILKSADDAFEQRAAIYVLGNYNHRLAVDITLPLLKNSDASIREAALLSLMSKINDFPRITQPLKVALSDDNEMVRRAAVMNFANFKGPNAIDIIKPYIEDKSPQVRQAVALSLGAQLKPQALEPLRKLIRDNDLFVRQAAVAVFPNIPGASVFDLIPRLSDSDWRVRKTAVDAVALFSNRPEIIKAAIPLLKDDNVFVRQTTAMYLGDKLQTYPQLTKDFINILKFDNDQWTKQIAAFSLQSVKTPEAKTIMPLIRQVIPEIKVVVISPGIDDFDLRTPGRELTQDVTKDWQLRKILELGGVKVIEHRWSGRMWEMLQVQRDFDATELKALNLAGKNGIILNIGYSAGNIVNERLFGHIKPGMNTPIAEAIKKGRIRVISLNSPSVYDFSKIDPGWKNFWASNDPFSRMSEVFSPNKYDIKYNYNPDITKDPREIHSGFKDPRVISNIVRQVFPNLFMPQLDKMLRQQDASSWKYFPSVGSWPGKYDFKSIAPPDYWKQEQFNQPKFNQPKIEAPKQYQSPAYNPSPAYKPYTPAYKPYTPPAYKPAPAYKPYTPPAYNPPPVYRPYTPPTRWK
ncbi:MAG: HEAT repeat domain-containing protein [Candidatus Omnitrophica bacterium]|nr:HEAT repeat domain-containing protein [Candidatus Omnitrophota bacterium]